MEENEMKIIIIRVAKTKSEKTILTYAMEDIAGPYYKGMAIIDQWIDGIKTFNNIKEDHIGIPLDATYKYGRPYKGKVQLVITSICDDDGNSILV